MIKWTLYKSEYHLLNNEIDILSLKNGFEEMQKTDPREPSWMSWFDLELNLRENGSPYD